jgi:hypothetical protein
MEILIGCCLTELFYEKIKDLVKSFGSFPSSQKDERLSQLFERA